MRRIGALSGLLVSLLAVAPTSYAQTRSDTEFVATAVVMSACPLASANSLERDKDRPEALSAAAAAFLAGIAGDAVTAGINALGAALEEASREKGFSAVGDTSFNYYKLELQLGKKEPFVLAPRLAQGSSLCLVLSHTNPATKPTSGRPSAQDLTNKSMQPDAAAKWPSPGLPENPDLYVELALQSRIDGFVVRPALVWYRNALPGAPKKAAPLELHVAFSTPASPSGEAAANFALARIRLPMIKPGELWLPESLANRTSAVLPARPTAGSPDFYKSRYAGLYTSLETSRTDLANLERSLARARAAASAKDATKDQKKKVDELDDQLRAVRDENTRLEAEWEGLANVATPTLGSTNVLVRFTVVRNANQFGLAIAKSLQGRSKALGEAVTSELTPATRASKWTSQDTNYVVAMSAVATAQRALDTAIASGDQDAIFSARIALKNAQATANAAAAASDRTLPFAGIL